MQCPNCVETSRIREKDNFCHKCGHKLKREESDLSEMKAALHEAILTDSNGDTLTLKYDKLSRTVSIL